MNPYDPLVQRSSESIPSSVAIVTSPTRTNRQEQDGAFTSKRTIMTCAKRLQAWGFEDTSSLSHKWFSSPMLLNNNSTTISPHEVITYGERKSRPMIIFSQLGDAPMMQHILEQEEKASNNNNNKKLACCTATDEHGLFPLYVTISKPHDEQQVLKQCQWLCRRGGASIHQTVGEEWTCLSRASLFGYPQVALWFLQEGILLDSNNSFSNELAQRDLPPTHMYESYASCEEVINAKRVHGEIFKWAHDVVTNRFNFMLFLSGTLSHNNNKKNPRQQVIKRLTGENSSYSSLLLPALLEQVTDDKFIKFLKETESPLVQFNGQYGILELIGQYVGGESSKILTTAKGLVQHETWWNVVPPPSRSGRMNSVA